MRTAKLSVIEAAKLLGGVTPQRVRQMLAAGELLGTRHAGGWIVDRASVDAVLEARAVAAREKATERQALEIVAQTAKRTLMRELLDLGAAAMAFTLPLHEAAATEGAEQMAALDAAEGRLLDAAEGIGAALERVRVARQRYDLACALPTLRRLGVVGASSLADRVKGFAAPSQTQQVS